MTRQPDPADHLPLHRKDFQILLSLVSGPSYGTRMVMEIEKQHEGSGKFYPANLFRRIRDLLARGLVRECDAPPGADPRRTYVTLTGLGQVVVRLEAQRMEELVREARALNLLEEGGR
jgi:DNA-binding PadR family transcriptional regulator